jgi:hypothetical protein
MGVGIAIAVVGLFLLVAPTIRKRILRGRGETEEIIHVHHKPAKSQTITTKSDGSSTLSTHAQPGHAQASAEEWAALTDQATKKVPPPADDDDEYERVPIGQVMAEQLAPTILAAQRAAAAAAANYEKNFDITRPKKKPPIHPPPPADRPSAREEDVASRFAVEHFSANLYWLTGPDEETRSVHFVPTFKNHASVPLTYEVVGGHFSVGDKTAPFQAPSGDLVQAGASRDFVWGPIDLVSKDELNGGAGGAVVVRYWYGDDPGYEMTQEFNLRPTAWFDDGWPNVWVWGPTAPPAHRKLSS